MRINLRNHKNAFVLSVDRFGDNLLRSAVAVHLRSVKQAHTKLDSQTQRCDSLARALLLSPMRHVPCPSTGTRLPSGSTTVLISIQSHLESGRNLFSTNFHTRVADYPTEYVAGKSPVVANALRGSRESRFSLARDRAQSFNQRLTLCAIVDNECVVFAMR